MNVDIGEMFLFRCEYEYVMGRYRHKKSCVILGESKEQVEMFLSKIVSGIDYMTTYRMTPINGITDEISMKISNVEYPVLRRTEEIHSLQDKDFDKFSREYQILPQPIHIINRSVEE